MRKYNRYKRKFERQAELREQLKYKIPPVNRWFVFLIVLGVLALEMVGLYFLFG
jgi:hypothetical protein